MNRHAKHPTPAPSDAWGRVAFRAGEAAALAGQPKDMNPHPADSVEAKNWGNGWRAVTARQPRPSP